MRLLAIALVAFSVRAASVYTSEVDAGASFSDVIHFLDGPGTAFLDATASCDCFKLSTGHASAYFTLGTASASMGAGFPFPKTVHLITQFALNGSVALDGHGGAGATDEVPYDENQGASSATASSSLRNYV